MNAATFRFTIDGIDVEATDGQSVIEACDAAGIYIPRLCYHPDLKTSGTCRVCTCKINGRNSAACVTPAAHGMVIENDTLQLTGARRAAEIDRQTRGQAQLDEQRSRIGGRDLIFDQPEQTAQVPMLQAQ